MARDDSLRAEVAEQLTTRSLVGGPLHRDAAECTEHRYATDVRRLGLHKHVIDRYLVERPDPDRLALSGHLNRRPVTMTLKRFDLDRFPLRSHHFHWVQQYPDNPLER